MSPYLDPAVAREAAKYEPQEDDVVLETYPKSSTQWTKQTIDLILRPGESAFNYVEFVARALTLKKYGVANVAMLPPPRLIGSHLYLLRNNINKARTKYVYVVCIPWECCVTYFHMSCGMTFVEFEDAASMTFSKRF
ncbi:hypothetical protein HPB47_020652 [Ixodes persulcatus]|uniref:Uncharacterized protein n=1 Tax=Ixodes persulcatus TaxID=34615 RepID=A0AC60QHE2_IXOPE|nr:hypothetical protein HPB47_020652 [Ixodes persulcatus]